MTNVHPDPKQFKKWRFNKWYWAIESDNDRVYACVMCFVKYGHFHDTSKQCHMCELSDKAPRIDRGENWDEMD